ncbi:hypothetical protein ACS0PU_000936 [Formica fusca]
MSLDAACKQVQVPIVTRTILPKKASEAEVIINTVCVSKNLHHSRKEVTCSGSKPSREEVLDAKRVRLRRLFECDAIKLENLLRELGYAFIPTQP